MVVHRLRGYDLKIEWKKYVYCYSDIGEGSTPIIFIHGFPFDKSCWIPQLEFLKHSNRVIAYDIRGYGESVADSSQPDLDLFAEDLIHFMDGLKIEKAIVCGLSMGGYILLNAVSKYPERFAAIVLCDTQCIADSEEAAKNRQLAIDQVAEGKLPDFAEKFISKVFCEKTFRDNPDLVAKIKNIVLSTSAETIIGGLTALKERDETCSSLPGILIPALIVCGKDDVLTPLKQSIDMHSSIKNSTLCVIEDAGHLSNLENPVQFNDYFHNFILNLRQ